MSQAAAPNISERLENVQVGVRAELVVSRHVFGDEPAYVVQDPITFQTHRFSIGDYQIFLAIRDDEPLKTTFERAVNRGIVSEEQKEDFYRFVLQLNRLGLLSLPLSKGSELYKRYQRKVTTKQQSRIMKLMFLRVPLFQPDRFLTRTERYFAPLFTRAAFVLWLIAIAASISIVYSRWDEFWSPVGTILAVQNLPILWTLLVGLKAFHELGHAYACKRFGGHVPEMGAYMILGTPCAYVDATAAWGFSSKLQRIIVSLGGMYFESLAAICAVFVWSMTSPGALNSAAQYAILLSTAVTLAFNANPLMKYDGYYVLSDLIEIPNLRGHSQRQFTRFVQRWLLNVRHETKEQNSRRKSLFLFLFGALSWLYKLVVVLGIAITIAFKVPTAGIALALFYVTNSIRQTLIGVIRIIRTLPSGLPRNRAIATVASITLTIIVGVLWVPLPTSTHLHGVLGNQEELMVHAGSSGFLVKASLVDGNYVEENSILCSLENRDLTTALIAKSLEIEQLTIQRQQELNEDLAAAAQTTKRLEKAIYEKRDYEKSVDYLQIRSPGDGIVTQAPIAKLTGSFIRQGEPVATIHRGGWVVRSVTTAAQLSNSKPQIGDSVTVVLPASPELSFEGKIRKISPAGTNVIDHDALTHIGGGNIAVESTTREAKQPYFELVVEIETGNEGVRNGMTAWVKLPTAALPFGEYLYRNGLNLLNRLRLAS